MKEEDLADTHIPLADAIDLEILMHRDVHFSGNFDIMIDYYKNKGVGIMPDFPIHRIKELRDIEHKMEKNLSDLLLPISAKETVERAKGMYADLKEMYHKQDPSPISLHISNIILSEEEVPNEELKALITMGKEAVPSLLDLVASQTFYDPLFPGYGRTPMFAAYCLAEIGDERAIPVLFEALGQENFYTDNAILKALHSFGEKAKQFLISRLKQKPFSKDNDHAAIALMDFSNDPEVLHTFFELLSQEEVQKRSSLAPYLIFGCSNLKEPQEREKFISISHSLYLTKELKEEMHLIISTWKKSKS